MLLTIFCSCFFNFKKQARKYKTNLFLTKRYSLVNLFKGGEENFVETKNNIKDLKDFPIVLDIKLGLNAEDKILMKVTVGENNIGALKWQNNHGSIKLLTIPILQLEH